jgi:molybdate transport system substrate-binding protein
MRNGKYLRNMAAVFALLFSVNSSAQERSVKVAAAADLKFVMAELGQKFRQKSGTRIDVTYGSSGNFFSQIQNGAPFDLFFSADIEYPLKLASAGTADGTTLYKYAIGRIVIWIPLESKLDVSHETWKALLDSTVQKIAIANPKHAPYGRAAVAAMQKANVYEGAKSKLVYGENISQAAQFVQSGSAQAGIIALSLAVSPGMKAGRYWMIPEEMHAPIEQAAIVLGGAKNKRDARAFLDFVQSPEAREILVRYGFQLPAGGIR